jgi:hypothetical protein
MLTHGGKIAVPNKDPKTWRSRGKKRKQPAVAAAIVVPKQKRASAIVEPKRKRSSAFGDVPDMTPEEHQRRGDAADALFRELVRRAALPDGE